MTQIGDKNTMVHFQFVDPSLFASFPESDVVVTAVVGMIGIRPTIAAIESRM